MDKLHKIGDVSKLCKVSVATLRYYEKFNLIKPTKVDVYTGYRYYNEDNVKKVKRILFLKDLNFSLQEIADFDLLLLKNKSVKLEQQMYNISNKLKIISSLKVDKGEIFMEFVNDERIIGKWKYETSAFTKEQYEKGEYCEEMVPTFDTLYFLPKGQGYWLMKSWSKGKIYHSGSLDEYEIINNKLYLICEDYKINKLPTCFIYNKVDSKEYTFDEIRIKDNIDLPFVLDEQVLGKWKGHAYVFTDDIENYVPRKESYPSTILELNFKDDGTVEHKAKVLGNRFEYNRKWTKNHILITEDETKTGCLSYTDCHYEIKTFDDEEYLYYEWKSGDYNFGNEDKRKTYYIFKKLK